MIYPNGNWYAPRINAVEDADNRRWMLLAINSRLIETDGVFSSEYWLILIKLGKLVEKLFRRMRSHIHNRYPFPGHFNITNRVKTWRRLFFIPQPYNGVALKLIFSCICTLQTDRIASSGYFFSFSSFDYVWFHFQNEGLGHSAWIIRSVSDCVAAIHRNCWVTFRNQPFFFKKREYIDYLDSRIQLFSFYYPAIKNVVWM